MLAHDRAGTSRFTAIQSEVPRALYRHFGLDPDCFETFMVLSGGVPYVRWAGLLAAGRTMPAPWSWLGMLGRLISSVIGDRIYDIIQRNRFGWFGRRDVCLTPSAEFKWRFLGG
jgi:predicted DCC family thiol-disulfide oxidoreductase YuxK